jgi:hypothetical protein
MSTVVKSPSPKARFQESADNVSKHRDLIQMKEFQRASDYALLQYAARLQHDTEGNLNAAAAAHLKMTGAQEFLATFRNLSESVELPSRRIETPNLDHGI